MKKVYVVVGVMDTGSASLTFPEDFDIKGFSGDKQVAQDLCDSLNPRDEDGNVINTLECNGEDMIYEVWDVDEITKK